MEFIGFCHFYSKKILVDGNTVEVKDPTDTRSLFKPFPPILSIKEEAESTKSEIAKNKKLHKDWTKNPYVSKEAKVIAEKMDDISNTIYDDMKELLKIKGWRFNGHDYQNNYIPVFKDAEGNYWKLCLSMRGWGGIVYKAEYELEKATIVKERRFDEVQMDGFDSMGYMNWYCENLSEPKFPEDSLLLKTVEVEQIDF